MRLVKRNKFKLGEIISDIAMGPFGSNIKTDNFISKGVPVIRGSNLNEGGFEEERFVYISEEKAQSLKRSLAYPDDLVFTHRGTIGQVRMIPPNKFPKYLVSQSQLKLTVNKDYLVPSYLLYFFKSNIGQYELLKNTSQVGVPAIASPTKSLKSVEIEIPELQTQSQISCILTTLDDKIELNNRMNKVLEQMAQAIFKQWFIDFEFPSESGDSYKSSGGEMEFCEELGKEIPRGWRIGKIIDIAEILMGQSPKSEFYNFKGEGLPFHQGVANYGYRFPVNNVYCTQLLRVAKKGSLLISVRAPVGRLNIADSDIIIGRGLGALNSKDNCNSYLFSLLQYTFAIEDQYGSGTIYNSISKKELENVKVIIPNSNIMLTYEYLTYDINQKITNQSRQIRMLTDLRDTLLPKLMSGEIDVSEVEL